MAELSEEAVRRIVREEMAAIAPKIVQVSLNKAFLNARVEKRRGG